jgi:hypothetical protein
MLAFTYHIAISDNVYCMISYKFANQETAGALADTKLPTD